MAFTKINAAGIGSTELVTLHSLEVLNNATVGGVLTYEDVTNVDSIGLITARNGIVVGSGITLSKDGDIFATGVTTTGSLVSSGAISGTTGTFSNGLDVTNNVDITDSIRHKDDTNTAIRFPDTDTFTVETAGSERLRITSDGSIGINDSSPNDYELDIMKRSGEENAQIRLYNNDTGSSNDTIMRYHVAGTSASNYIYFGDGDDGNAGQIRYQHSNDSMQFYANAVERIRIKSDGHVGIGSHNPASILDIREEQDGAETKITLFNTDNDNTTTQTAALYLSPDSRATALTGLRSIKENADMSTSAARDVSLTLNTLQNNSQVEALRIDSSGRVLIGTTTEGQADADNLTIADSGSCGITLRSGTSAAGAIYFSDDTSGAAEYDGAVLYNQSSRYMDFYTAQSQRLRIDSSGRLMIATISTSGISASGDDIIIGSIDDSTARGLTFATTGAGSIRWADAGDNAMGRIQYDNSTDVMTFHTSNTTRLRLDSDGGIKFGSDTAAASALDDYEEGSFTPTISDGSGNNSTFGSITSAKYTKIGDTVRASFRAVNVQTSGLTGSDVFYVKGLPFTTTGRNYNLAFIRSWNASNWSAAQSVVAAFVESDQVAFYGDDGSTTGGVVLKVEDMINNQTDIFMTMLYATTE